MVVALPRATRWATSFRRDGVSLAEFEFDVVAPGSYDYPAVPPPDPSARSTDNS